MGRINQYPKANAINDSDTLLGVVGGTTKQVAKDVLLGGVTSDISNTTIVGKKAGKVITADDSSNNGIPEVTVYGRSEQKSYTGKNLLEYTYEHSTNPISSNGISFLRNDDNSITISGTATNNAFYQIDFTNSNLEIGQTYTMSLSEKDIGVGMAFGTHKGNAGVYTDIANTKTKTNIVIPNTYSINGIYISVPTGTTVNATVYPMIRLASITDDTYEPFVGGEVSPNPSFPQSITSVADDKSLVVKSVGKNLLENTLTTQTTKGITFTVNEDKSVTANGTATNDIYINVNNSFGFKKDITYILSGCPSGGTTSTYLMAYTGMTREFYDYGNGSIFTLDEDLTTNILIIIKSGTTVNNLVFKPMIRSADIEDATYEPYITSQANLTLVDSLRGIPVTEGGNYTDEDGQSWICNTIEKRADGTGKYIQRIESKVLNGSEAWYEFTNTGGLFYQYYTNLTDSKDFSNVMCTHFTPIALSDRTTTTGVIEYNDQTLRFALQPAYGLDSISKWKEWLAENNVTVFYALAEPIEIDLTASQMAELERLMSFNPYTTVYTDDMGEIAITYFKNSDSGKIVGSLNDRISNLVALLQSNGVI